MNNHLVFTMSINDNPLNYMLHSLKQNLHSIIFLLTTSFLFCVALANYLYWALSPQKKRLVTSVACLLIQKLVLKIKFPRWPIYKLLT